MIFLTSSKPMGCCCSSSWLVLLVLTLLTASNGEVALQSLVQSANPAPSSSMSASERRALSEKLMAGYEPRTDVRDQARIDLDQQLIEQYLDGHSQQSFTYARNIYSSGAFSKTVASIELDDALPFDVKKFTRITGTSVSGGEVSLNAYTDLRKGGVKVFATYILGGCNVGGITAPENITRPIDPFKSGDQVWAGCLKEKGTIVIAEKALSYKYSVPEDNWNARTIATFSETADVTMRPDEKKMPFFRAFEKFNSYYGSPEYATHWITAAFLGQKTDMKNGNADFGLYPFPARAEPVKLGTVTMAILMFVIRELEDAVYDCEQGCDTAGCNDDEANSLDEAVAYYTGSLEGTDGLGQGLLLYDLADKRAADFKTAGRRGDEAGGQSKLNYDIFKQFQLMQGALRQKQCDKAKENKNRIAQLIYVPVIQGALRSAYRTDKRYLPEIEKDQVDLSAEAEGATYAAAVLPVIAACNPGDAEIIYQNLKVGQGGSVDFKAVKKAFEDNYKCMGISCGDVGGLWNDPLDKYETDAAPCSGGASRFGLHTILVASLSMTGMFFFL